MSCSDERLHYYIFNESNISATVSSTELVSYTESSLIRQATAAAGTTCYQLVVFHIGANHSGDFPSSNKDMGMTLPAFLFEVLPMQSVVQPNETATAKE